MSMTVTMNDAGMVALPESVRHLFGIKGARDIELDVESDGVKLRLVSTSAENEVPMASIEYRDGFPVIVGTPPLSDEEVVGAIKAGRDERSEELASRHRWKA